MGKLIKLLLGFTVLLVLIIVVTVAGVVLFFDPNEYKDFIISQLEEKTGRDFTLAGDVNLTLYPWLGLEAGGITIGNAEGFGETPFLQAEHIALRIKTMPLLKKQYELDTLKLYGLELNLTKNKKGITNWSDLAGPETEKPTSKQPIQLGAVILGGVDIKNGQISWQDQQADQKIRISDLNATTGPLSYGDPINLKVGFKADANKPALKSDLQLNGILNYDLESEVYSFKPIDLTAKLSGKNVPGGTADLIFKAGVQTNLDKKTAELSDLSLDVMGLSIRGNIAATDIQSDTPAAKGQIAIKGEDLARLMKVLEVEPAATELAKLSDRSFDIKVNVDTNLENDAITLSGLNAQMLGTSLKGQLDLTRIRTETPGVKGNLLTEGDDLLWVTHVAGMHSTASELSKLKDRSFSIKTELDADMKKGTAKITNLDASLLDTTVKAQLDISGLGNGAPNVKGTVDTRGSDIARLLRVGGLTELGNQLDSISDRSFNLKTDLDANMKKGDIRVSGLKANLLGAAIQGDIDASNTQSDTPSAKGKLQANGPDLPALLQLAGQLLGGKETALSNFGRDLAKASNKAFDVATEFNADMKAGDISLPVLSVKTLGITVDGKLQGKAIKSNKASMDGKLSVRGEQVSDVLSAMGQPDLGKVMKSVAVDAVVSGSQGDIALSPLQVKATFAGKDIPNSPVDITFSANTQVNMEKQVLSAKNLSLSGLGLNVKSNVSATNLLENPVFKGDLDITEFNLRQLASQLNQQLPDTADKKVFSKVALKTGFAASNDSLSLSELAMKMDETQLFGSFSVNQFKQPDIRFGLKMDAINADRYLPPPGKGEQKKPVTPESAAGAVASKAPVETLRSLRINGDMQIGQLIISNARLNNVKLSLHAKDGEIVLEPATADLYNGKYQGKVLLDAKGKVPHIQLNTQLSGVQLEPLIKDYTQKPDSQLAGIASLTATNLTATGNDGNQIKQTLTGKAQFSIKDGVLRGIDVRKTLEAAEVLLESKRIGTVKQGGETRFEHLGGTLDINNGVVINKDLLMKAPGFQVTGEGMLANLHDNTIKYNMKVGVDESSTTRGQENYNIGGYKIPIQCRGKLDAIATACQPDLAGLASVALEKTVKEKIQESLTDKLGIKLPGSETPPPAPPEQQTTQTQPAPAPETSQQQDKPKDPAKQLEEELKKNIGDALKGIF